MIHFIYHVANDPSWKDIVIWAFIYAFCLYLVQRERIKEEKEL